MQEEAVCLSSVSNVNAVLAGGYHYHGKDYSGRRAPELARSVKEWVADPRIEGRQAGWVDEGCSEYGGPIRRIAVHYLTFGVQPHPVVASMADLYAALQCAVARRTGSGAWVYCCRAWNQKRCW